MRSFLEAALSPDTRRRPDAETISWHEFLARHNDVVTAMQSGKYSLVEKFEDFEATLETR